MEANELDSTLPRQIRIVEKSPLVWNLEHADVVRVLLPALGDVRVLYCKVQRRMTRLGDLQAWREITADDDVLILLLGRSV